MAELMHRVFISSTCLDLPKHRDHAHEACEALGLVPVDLKNWPAGTDDGIEESLRRVDSADIYVGIFAYRYGYRPNPNSIAVTEMEYRRAVERVGDKKIPILIFLMHPAHDVKESDVDKAQEDRDSLAALKDHLRRSHTCKEFKSPLELRAQIIAALANVVIKQLTALIPGEPPDALSPSLPKKTVTKRRESLLPRASRPTPADRENQAAPRPKSEPEPEPEPERTAPEKSPLAVKLLLAVAAKGDNWDFVPLEGPRLAKISKVRLMALPETRCHLLLAVEAFFNDGVSEVTCFGPRGTVDGLESLIVEPTGIWTSLPSGGFLTEQAPDMVSRWNMVLIGFTDASGELEEFVRDPTPSSLSRLTSWWLGQSKSISPSLQDVSGPDLGGKAEVVRIVGDAVLMHSSEIEFV